jgi:ketosteroid isomerase-like protein
MRKPTRWAIVIVSSALGLACGNRAPQAAQTARGTTDADVAAIKAVQDREIAMAATGNMDSLLTVIGDDPELMPPDEPAVHGRDGLRKWAEGMFAQSTLSGRYTSSDVTVSGDLAVVRYVGDLTVTPKSGGGAVTEHIKGIHVMKRQPDGAWKITQDVWNSDAPAPAAPPPAAPTKSK